MSTKGTKIPEHLQVPFAGVTPAPTQERGQDLFALSERALAESLSVGEADTDHALLALES